RGRVAVVAAVRPRIARVAGLRHLVVAGLRVGRVHDAAAAPDLVDARAEAAEDVDEEGRHDEARLIAAALRAAGDAAVGVVRHLTSRNAHARCGRVAARDAEVVLAGREGCLRRHRERGLRPGGEWHYLSVG